jgi:hypothetical protein
MVNYCSLLAGQGEFGRLLCHHAGRGAKKKLFYKAYFVVEQVENFFLVEKLVAVVINEFNTLMSFVLNDTETQIL